jgi:hypothetical protein
MIPKSIANCGVSSTTSLVSFDRTSGAEKVEEPTLKADSTFTKYPPTLMGAASHVEEEKSAAVTNKITTRDVNREFIRLPSYCRLRTSAGQRSRHPARKSSDWK